MAKQEHKPQWTRLSPDERRAAILEVAARHFAERPYDAVSTIEIASEAGVNRGLIHHYVGTKRDLYLEVLRQSLRVPQFPPLLASAGADFEDMLRREIGAWLDEVERNRETWLAAQRAVGGFGRDPEVERLVQEMRDIAIDDALRVMIDPADAPPALHGLISSLAALAVQALVEWLELGRLSRDQVHALLLHASLSIWQNIESLLAGRV